MQMDLAVKSFLAWPVGAGPGHARTIYIADNPDKC